QPAGQAGDPVPVANGALVSPGRAAVHRTRRAADILALEGRQVPGQEGQHDVLALEGRQSIAREVSPWTKRAARRSSPGRAAVHRTRRAADTLALEGRQVPGQEGQHDVLALEGRQSIAREVSPWTKRAARRSSPGRAAVHSQRGESLDKKGQARRLPGA